MMISPFIAPANVSSSVSASASQLELYEACFGFLNRARGARFRKLRRAHVKLQNARSKGSRLNYVFGASHADLRGTPYINENVVS